MNLWLCGSPTVCSQLPLALTPGALVLGRDRACDVVIRDSLVSRRHARLTLDLPSRLYLEDLRSSNHVYVNAVRVENATLAPGDTFTLGVVEFQIGRSPLAYDPQRDGPSTVRVRRDEESLRLACDKLTTKQQRVFRLLLDGFDEQQIALRCGCRPRTAHNHVQAIYERLDVHSRQQLLAQFLGVEKSPS